MSNLVCYVIDDKINYNLMVKISNQITELCLKKHLGCIFNFGNYDEKLLNNFKSNFYFSLSDDFFQLNSEFLNTYDIKNIKSTIGKIQFIHKFEIFDKILNILHSNRIKSFKLIISTTISDGNLNDFIKINYNHTSTTDILYNNIIKNSNIYAYGFPDVVVYYND